MMMDTCFSGGFADGQLKKGVANFSTTYQQLVQEGMVIWASSTGNEESIEHDDWANGAFTEALVQGIGGTEADFDGDGVLTELELETFVSRRVRDLTGGTQHFFSDKPPGSDFPMFGVTDPNLSSDRSDAAAVLPTTGFLTVSSMPSGATVTVDGQVVGKTPVDTEVNLGLESSREVEVGLALNGYRSTQARILVERGDRASWRDAQMEQVPARTVPAVPVSPELPPDAAR